MELSRGVVGSIKQPFSQNTLVEYECSDLREGGKKSPMSNLVDENEALRKQVKKLIATLGKKDADLTLLNAEVAKGSRGGPNFVEVIELREVNA